MISCVNFPGGGVAKFTRKKLVREVHIFEELQLNRIELELEESVSAIPSEAGRKGGAQRCLQGYLAHKKPHPLGPYSRMMHRPVSTESSLNLAIKSLGSWFWS